jgi:hypothetical protein
VFGHSIDQLKQNKNCNVAEKMLKRPVFPSAPPRAVPTPSGDSPVSLRSRGFHMDAMAGPAEEEEEMEAESDFNVHSPSVEAELSQLGISW